MRKGRGASNLIDSSAQSTCLPLLLDAVLGQALIESLLQPRPEKRCTIADALESAWISKPSNELKLMVRICCERRANASRQLTRPSSFPLLSTILASFAKVVSRAPGRGELTTERMVRCGLHSNKSLSSSFARSISSLCFGHTIPYSLRFSIHWASGSGHLDMREDIRRI